VMKLVMMFTSLVVTNIFPVIKKIQEPVW
jgi:hypothetical protein